MFILLCLSAVLTNTSRPGPCYEGLCTCSRHTFKTPSPAWSMPVVIITLWGYAVADPSHDGGRQVTIQHRICDTCSRSLSIATKHGPATGGANQISPSTRDHGGSWLGAQLAWRHTTHRRTNRYHPTQATRARARLTRKNVPPMPRQTLGTDPAGSRFRKVAVSGEAWGWGVDRSARALQTCTLSRLPISTFKSVGDGLQKCHHPQLHRAGASISCAGRNHSPARSHQRGAVRGSTGRGAADHGGGWLRVAKSPATVCRSVACTALRDLGNMYNREYISID